jgi:hypothetical protein
LQNDVPHSFSVARNEIVAFRAHFRYTLVQGGFLMKKRLVILFAIALCLLVVAPAMPAWAADPGTRYADAFVLIEQGQTAEEKADLVTAYHNYQSALSTLHSIRTDSPDWNPQMVEYRLKDCQARFDAIKAKLPEPPPAPDTAASVATAVTPAVEAPAPPPAPVVTPPPPPPAPVVKAATDDQSAKLKTEINQLQAENHQLKSDLTDAKRAAKSSSQVDALAKENKDLKAQLAAAEKKAAAVKPPAPVPVDSSEAKKLRTELANANAEIDRLKKAGTTPPQNFQQGSSTVIASPVVAAPPSDSAELKNLRAELNKTRAEADAAKKSAAQVPDLQKQNKDLSAKLAAAEKKTNIAPTDSSEVKSLRAELDKSNAEVADLKKQVAAKPVIAPAPVPVGDNNEVKGLRAQLSDTQKQLDQSKKSASQIPDLEKQNQDLNAKLAAADKKASARAAELEKENKDLNSKLAAEKKEEAEAPTVAPDVRVMKHLRDENSYLRNLLDTYAEQNSELKGQLRRHDQNQIKSGQ